MFNFENSFNGMFGKIASGLCRLTMNGNIAVKCSNGYKTYDVSKNMITNVTNFCFNLGDDKKLFPVGVSILIVGLGLIKYVATVVAVLLIIAFLVLGCEGDIYFKFKNKFLNDLFTR